MRVSNTRWSVVQAAQAGDAAALRALSVKYRAPVLSFLRGRGLRHDEAEDVAQEVFIQLTSGALARADAERGRFRGLLFAISHNHLVKFVARATAAKRGGGAVRSLGDLDPSAPPAQDAFDREWLAGLLRSALAQLEEKHPAYFQALTGALLEGKSHAQLARELGTSAGAIKKQVHRGRGKLFDLLREEVWQSSRSVADFEQELQHLARLTGRLGPRGS